MNREQRRAQKGRKAQDRWWFVAFGEVGLGAIAIKSIGPLRRHEVASTLEKVLVEENFDGVWEWDGEPNRLEVQQAVQTGRGIAGLRGARRLVVHPKHAKQMPKNYEYGTSGTAEYVAATLGLDQEEEEEEN